MIAWYWWILIGLAVGGFLLLVWSLLAIAKYSDEDLERHRRYTDRAKRNGIGRP